MAKLTADLQDPDVRAAARPQQGVADTHVDRSDAQFIQNAGTLGLELDKSKRMADLSIELNEQRDQYLENFQEAALTEGEMQLVDGFGNKMGKLASAKAAGLTETQFRVRTEAILREHIASMPGLEQEFRAKANSVLGYDPTGSTLEAAFEAMESGNKQQAALAEARRKDYVAKGGAFDAYGTPEGEEWYAAVQEMEANAARLDVQAGLSEYQAPEYAGALYSGVTTAINTMSDELFGKNIRSLTPEDIRTMSPEEMNSALEGLEALRHDAKQGMMITFPTMDVSRQNDLLLATNDYIDNTIAYVKGEISKEMLDNKVATHTNMLVGRALNTPEGSGLMLWSKLAPGTPAPNELVLKAQGRWFSEVVKGYTPDAVTIPVDQLQQGTKWLSDASTEVDSNAFVEAWTNSKSVISKTYKGIMGLFEEGSPNQKQVVLDMLTNPDLAQQLRQLPPDDPKIKQMLAEGLRYGVDSGRAAAIDLETNNILDFEYASGKFVRDLVSVNVKDGLVSVNIDTSDPDGISAAKTVARNLQKKYVDRVNTAVKAMAGLQDISTEEAYAQMVRQNPTAFRWVSGSVEEPTPAPTPTKPEGTTISDITPEEFNALSGEERMQVLERSGYKL